VKFLIAGSDDEICLCSRQWQHKISTS
jgi:hypothetical protein